MTFAPAGGVWAPVDSSPNSPAPSAPLTPMNKPNSIIFPIVAASLADHKHPQTGQIHKCYSPRRLRAKLARSANASDHLSRIQVTSATYCTWSSNGQHFECILFAVKDVALPGTENVVILKQTLRQLASPQPPTINTKGSASSSRASKFPPTGCSLLTPALFCIPPFGQPNDTYNKVLFKQKGELVLSSATTSFPLEALIVLASTLSSPRYLKQRLRMLLNDSSSGCWFLQTMWITMGSINNLPKPLSTDMIVDVSGESRHHNLAARILQRFTRDLHNFRNNVIRLQHVSSFFPTFKYHRILTGKPEAICEQRGTREDAT